MKTVIYIDVLLLVNFLIGYFLLRATAKLCGAALTVSRALLGAGLAALSTLILLAPELPGPLGTAYKLVSAALVALAAFGYKGLRPYLRVMCWYFVLNLLLAGVVLLFIYRGGAAGMEMNNLTVYINLSPLVLLCCVLAVYCFLKLLLLLFGKPGPINLWQLSVLFEGSTTLRLQAYYDTGFFLKDPLSGKQAILVSWPSVKNQLPPAVNQFLEQYFAHAAPLPPQDWRLRILFCESAVGGAAIPGFLAKNAALLGDGKAYECQNLTVAFTDRPLGDGQFAALFGNEFLLSETKRRKEPCPSD